MNSYYNFTAHYKFKETILDYIRNIFSKTTYCTMVKCEEDDHMMDYIRYCISNKPIIKRIKRNKLFYRFVRKIRERTLREILPEEQSDPINGRIVKNIKYVIDNDHGCVVKIETECGYILSYKCGDYNKRSASYKLTCFSVKKED